MEHPAEPATARDPGTDGRLSPRHWLAAILTAVAAFLYKLLTSTRRGFWTDEYYTFNAAGLPIPDLISDRLAAGHSPFIFFYARLFRFHGGETEMWYRASSALACAVAIIGLTGILDRLRLRRALVPALALAFFSPYWQLIGTEFRYMMPQVAMTALWAWAYISFLQLRGPLLALAVAVAGAITLAIAGSAQFVLVALLLFAAMSVSLRHGCGAVSVGPWARYSPLLVAMLVNIPLLVLIAQHSSGGGANRSAWPDPTDLVENQVSTFFGEAKVLDSVTGISYGLWRLVYIVLTGFAFWGAWSWLRRNPRPLAGRFLLAMLLGIPLGVVVYSRLADNVQGTLRYVAPASVAVIPALALGWMEAGRFGRRGLAARIVFAFMVLVSFSMETLSQGDGLRDAVRWLAPQRKPDQPLVTLGARMVYQALDFHDFPWREGHYRGVEWDEGTAERVAQELAEPLAIADSTFLFLYRGDSRDHRRIDEALENLRGRGLVVYTREWLFSDSMKIIGLARTDSGRQALESMPDAPSIRFSSDPL